MLGAGEVWGILGGGFGLYGYLPAVAERTEGKIHTLVHYRETIQGRKDIRAFEDRIVFEKDAADIFARCNVVVIALRPADQELILAEILEKQWMGKLVLEKPLARNPQLALALLEDLTRSGIEFRIGFTLGATEWAASLAQFLDANRQSAIALDFQWLFLAHHYRADLKTWKRYRSLGGGATRFYTIHLIALFAKLGLTKAIGYASNATEGDEEPECRFAVSSGNCKATVVCNSKWQGDPIFRIRAITGGAPSFEVVLDDPFRKIIPDVQNELLDGRVGYLSKILNSLNEEGNTAGSYYMGHVNLWAQLEKICEPWNSPRSLK